MNAMERVREMAAAPTAGEAAEEGFVSAHPWMTLVIALVGLGTVSSIAMYVFAPKAAEAQANALNGSTTTTS
jgi:hypothetical protein